MIVRSIKLIWSIMSGVGSLIVFFWLFRLDILFGSPYPSHFWEAIGTVLLILILTIAGLIVQITADKDPDRGISAISFATNGLALATFIYILITVILAPPIGGG